MALYILRRLLTAVPLILAVSFVVFMMLRLVPGDPARAMLGDRATEEDLARLRRSLGLDQPIPVQYAVWLGNLLHGDLGRSIKSGRPVTGEIMSRLPNTIQLAVAAMVVAMLIGVAAGVVSAVRHNTFLDHAAMFLALLGVSVPSFWLGLLLILTFGLAWPILPIAGMGGPQNLIMPAVTLGAIAAATVARLTRSSLLEVLSQDYVRTARAKGLNERATILGHALKNGLIPVVTVIGLQFGFLLSGTVVVETVFAWPGVGRLLIDNVLGRDFPIVQGTVLLIAVIFILVNLCVDIAYAFIDPRIRYS